MMNFITSTKGKPMLIDRGYLYVRQKDLANNAVSWECTERRKMVCKAKLKIQNDAIIDRVNDHTHAPNQTKVAVAEVRATMKRRAETTLDAPHRIISEGLAHASAAVAVNIPRMENIRRAVRRYRDGNAGLPANPRNRAGIPAIPNNLAITTNGDRFLLFDSGAGDANRLIMFGTDQALNLLRQSDHWFGDGTFSVSPAIFYQVYTIHSMCNGKVVPCVFSLLPNKTEATYDRLFTEIRNNMNGHAPTDMMFDFERAAFNAISQVFPGIDPTCCFFHLCKNIFKHIQRNGLADLYEIDDEFSLLMRMIAALAFVPEVDAPQAFYDLETEIRNRYNNNGVDVVLDYFEDNYIGRQRRGRPRAPPTFAISLWNMVDRTQVGLPRTNNHIEGWHNRFSLNVDGVHPTFWKFVESLQREESLVRAEIHQLLGGHQVVQKRKYAQCAERVRNIVNDYPVRRANILNYLESIAHNLAF